MTTFNQHMDFGVFVQKRFPVTERYPVSPEWAATKRDIRDRLAAGQVPKAVAIDMNVSPSTVYKVKNEISREKSQ
tara:strand:+ start:45 stop:269 length:225 start_codon:yes stop_codon:yes gene_type:complete